MLTALRSHSLWQLEHDDVFITYLDYTIDHNRSGTLVFRFISVLFKIVVGKEQRQTIMANISIPAQYTRLALIANKRL